MRYALLLLLGCTISSRVEEIPALDRDVFDRDVEPILERKCSDPTCHARPERALALYAPLRRRSDPARTFIPEPLSEDELAHNYVASCLLSDLVLQKPLAGSGVFHAGGVAWERGDRDYAAIARWVSP